MIQRVLGASVAAYIALATQIASMPHATVEARRRIRNGFSGCDARLRKGDRERHSTPFDIHLFCGSFERVCLSDVMGLIVWKRRYPDGFLDLFVMRLESGSFRSNTFA
jgi:hypothetical protein